MNVKASKVSSPPCGPEAVMYFVCHSYLPPLGVLARSAVCVKWVRELVLSEAGKPVFFQGLYVYRGNLI